MAGIGLNRSRQAPAQDTPSFGAIAERFRRAGDLDRAIALCEEGLKKFPNQLSARVTLGWALLDKGEYDLARQELERVIRRAPDNLAAIRGLAELHDRAEHAVTGIDSNGVWTPPEELSDEPALGADAPGASFDVEAQAAVVEQPEVHLAAPPLPPLPVPEVTAAEVDPQSLIETPAQAAVAHAGAAEPASVFEDASGPVSQPPAELVSPAALAIDGLEVASAPDSALEAEPLLIAENGEIELARMASELAASPSEAGVPDAVIDLPAADPDIEGAFFQFEDAAAEPAPSEGIALLDPQIDIPVVEAFDESLLDPEFSPALGVELAAANGIDLVMSVEPEHEVATVLAFDQTAASGLDGESGWSGAVDALGEVSGEPEPLLIEAQPAAEIPETVEFSEVLQPPADVQALAVPEPLHEALPTDFQGHSPVELDGPAEFEPAAGMTLEPTVEVAFESTVETNLEPAVEIAVGRVEEDAPVETEQAVAPWPAVAAEPEADAAGPAVDVTPTGIFAPVAHGDDDDDQEVPEPGLAADDADQRAESDESQDLPGLAAAAAAQLPDSDADLFPMPAMAQEPVRGGAPIAALEGFLRKISARRLHLTPGSVA